MRSDLVKSFCLFLVLFFLFPAGVFAARSLSLHTSGEDVTVLQEILIAHDYLAEGNAIGYFGPLTQAAVQEFQCAHNIICGGTANDGYGVYGPRTQATLAEVTKNPINPARLNERPLTPPATGSFEVSGWIPYWRAATGTQDTLPHLSKLDSIMPFGYTMKTNGTLADTAGLSEEPWTSFIEEAREAGVLVIPSVMWGSGETIHRILRNTNKREALAAEIAQAVAENDFDGIDIDFEAKKHETLNYFSEFLRSLDQRLGDKALYCTVEARMPLEHRYPFGAIVPPDATNRANDYIEMNKYCDRVEIMAYDQGRVDKKLNAEHEEPYAPVSDTSWAESLVRLAAQTIERDKIILGIPTYGYGYRMVPLGDGTYDYRRLWAFNPQYALDIAKDLGIKPERTSAGEIGFTYDYEEYVALDEDHKPPRRARRDAWEQLEEDDPFNFVTWSDTEAIEEKIELAHELGLRGVAFFKFDGGQDPEIWDLLE